jgi:curved DNA-binding protein CbpA
VLWGNKSSVLSVMQDAEVRKAYLKLVLHHPDKSAATCKCTASLESAPADPQLQARLRTEAEAVFQLVLGAKEVLKTEGGRRQCREALAREAALHGLA